MRRRGNKHSRIGAYCCLDTKCSQLHTSPSIIRLMQYGRIVFVSGWGCNRI